MKRFEEGKHIKENLEGLLKVIRDQISFRICTGCSGIENPFSSKLGAEIGMGCEECHDTGVVLEDYRGFSEFIENEEFKAKISKLEQEKRELVDKLGDAITDLRKIEGQTSGEMIALENLETKLARIKSEVPDATPKK